MRPTTSGSAGCDLESEQGLGEDLLGREGAQDLVEESDGDRAGGQRGGSAAMLECVARGEGIGELFAVESDVVADSVRPAGEQLVAQGGELGAGGASGVVGLA